MGQILAFRANGFVPTAARTGNNSPSIFRGSNMFIRGLEDNVYAECYSGSLDLSHDVIPVPLTGTLATTIGQRSVVGTGTLFRTELYPGMRILVIGASVTEHIVVDEVIDNTHFNAVSNCAHTETGQSGLVSYVLFEINKKRGALLWGNVLQFDQGTLLGVGLGSLYVDGSAIPGDVFLATLKAQIAILNGTTGNYTVQQLGFDDYPAGIVPTAGTAPVSKTFVDTDVNTGTDVITIAAHGYATGQAVTLSNPGTQISVAGALLNANRVIFIIKTGANTVKLADTLQDAVALTALDITNAGAGTTTVAPVSKHMQAGDRSIRIAKASTKLGTPEFGNPGPPLKVTLTADQVIDVPLPAMDSNTDSHSPHDAYRIYGSLGGGDATSATANANGGPWYEARTVSAADLDNGTAGGTFKLEYNDAEIVNRDIITFDNNPPPDALFIGTVAGYPVLVSAQGKPTATRPTGTAPGPSLVPFKPNNLAAAPLVLDSGQRNEVPLSPPEDIIGFYMAAGRLYLMTANTLQIAVFTSDPDFPVATRPFWKSGFRNPYALCFVNGRLYGFTSAGPMRSVTDGEEGSEEHRFASDVEEIMRTWKPENAFVQHDPQNECVCYINSGFQKNSNGYWDSQIVPFMLRSETWSLPILITSPTADRIITGAATINGHLEFIAGGREPGAFLGRNSKMFRFDQVSGETVNYSIAWQLTDAGSENRPKRVKRPTVRGKITSGGTIGIHGAFADEEINIAAIEAGNSGSKTGAIALSNSASGVRYRPAQDVAVGGLMIFTPEVTGAWNGVGDRDRIDEVTLEVAVQGARR